MEIIVFILGLMIVLLLAIIIRMSQKKMVKKYNKKTFTSNKISEGDWAEVQKDFDIVFKTMHIGIEDINYTIKEFRKVLDKVEKK